MITIFDSLFAGHVDMSNVGYAGTAVNARSFPNDYLLTGYDKAQAIAQLMDRTDYDTLWLAEHHFQREGYEVFPNIMLFGVHLAHLTQKIKIGCAFNILPTWNPLRIAEDYAVAEHLTGNRVRLGVGRGYHTREVEVFGSPLLNQEANRNLFEEQLDVMFKAFNEESFAHHGKYYDLPPKGTPYRGYELENITLVPRPTNRPVECWQPIQSATQRGLDFMVKHGIKGIIGGGVADPGAHLNVVEKWREAQARGGKETALGENLSIGFHIHMADTQQKAIREASTWFEENIKMFGPVTRGLSEEQLIELGDPSKAHSSHILPRLDEYVKGGGWLYGPPDKIIEKLKETEGLYPGLDRIDISHPMGVPQEVILHDLEWFASDVMPTFKDRVRASASAV